MDKLATLSNVVIGLALPAHHLCLAWTLGSYVSPWDAASGIPATPPIVAVFASLLALLVCTGAPAAFAVLNRGLVESLPFGVWRVTRHQCIGHHVSMHVRAGGCVAR